MSKNEFNLDIIYKSKFASISENFTSLLPVLFSEHPQFDNNNPHINSIINSFFKKANLNNF